MSDKSQIIWENVSNSINTDNSEIFWEKLSIKLDNLRKFVQLNKYR